MDWHSCLSFCEIASNKLSLDPVRSDGCFWGQNARGVCCEQAFDREIGNDTCLIVVEEVERFKSS